jgi:glycosyltransferase involved in cell wall biosynthesis
LFAPGDTDAMADAMARLLRDPALASAIGRSARKRVLQSFPEARTVKQIEKLYTDLIGGDRNGFESN